MNDIEHKISTTSKVITILRLVEQGSSFSNACTSYGLEQDIVSNALGSGLRKLRPLAASRGAALPQHIKKLCENFVKAKRIFKTSGHKANCECIEGCCYGTDASPLKNDGHYKLCGKLFWEFISGDSDLYTDIIEPLGINASFMNQKYKIEYDKMITRFSKDFGEIFSDKEGNLLWNKILKLNSGYPDDFILHI